MPHRQPVVVRNETTTYALGTRATVSGTEIYCDIDENGQTGIGTSGYTPCTLNFTTKDVGYQRVFFSATVSYISAVDEGHGGDFGRAFIAIIINNNWNVTPTLTVEVEWGRRENATITGALDLFGSLEVEARLVIGAGDFDVSLGVGRSSLDAILGQGLDVQECWVPSCG